MLFQQKMFVQVTPHRPIGVRGRFLGRFRAAWPFRQTSLPKPKGHPTGRLEELRLRSRPTPGVWLIQYMS